MLRILSMAFALALVVPAAADELYDHNGSLMRLSERGGRVTIAYEEPRPGLVRQGVRHGTVLFEGELDAGLYLEGMSNIFRAGCAPTDYYVYGQYRPRATFTLGGAAPVLAPTGCAVVDNVYEGSNANLQFVWLRAAPTDTLPVAGDGTLCVTGVSSALNVRSGPGSGFGVLGTIAAGRCGIAGYDQCRDGWCFVAADPAAGRGLGWVAAQYLSQR